MTTITDDEREAREWFREAVGPDRYSHAEDARHRATILARRALQPQGADND